MTEDNKKHRQTIVDAIDTGGGQTTDVLRVIDKLFDLPLETRQWFAVLLTTEHPVRDFDWDGDSI